MYNSASCKYNLYKSPSLIFLIIFLYANLCFYFIYILKCKELMDLLFPYFPLSLFFPVFTSYSKLQPNGSIIFSEAPYTISRIWLVKDSEYLSLKKISHIYQVRNRPPSNYNFRYLICSCYNLGSIISFSVLRGVGNHSRPG